MDVDDTPLLLVTVGLLGVLVMVVASWVWIIGSMLWNGVRWVLGW